MTAPVSIATLVAEHDFAGSPGPRDFGAAPHLTWIAIDRLVVDPAYQRPIGATGRANIRRIAAEFRWSEFSAVIVAAVEGGGFAIVDGQHRTIAAALAGIDAVPCQVVAIDRREQARAFVAVNGRVTRMSPLALHKAAAVGGEPQAAAIERVAAAAGITVLAYPKREVSQAPGETMAVAAIGGLIREAGEETARVALSIVRASAGDRPGAILMAIIKATGERVIDLRGEGRGLDEIERAFAGVDLLEAWLTARAMPARPTEAAWMRLLRTLRAEVV